MAAARWKSGTHRIQPFFNRYSVLARNLGQVTKIEGTHSSRDDPRTGIPLVPKHRDPGAVLKALASTVDQPKQPLFMNRSSLDPFSPRNRRQMLDWIMAKEAGKRAGEYVVNRYPKLFPGRYPVPDLRPWRAKWKGLNEETLKDLIKAKKLRKAQEVYNELLGNGESVSLATQNGLLALLAFVGVGNSPLRADDEDTGVEDELVTSSTDEAMEELKTLEVADDAVRTEEQKPRRKLERKTATWSPENEAEKMFAGMSEKDGGTYGAMIQGTVKYDNFTRALELFEEAREKGLQLPLSSYNRLLSGLLDSKLPSQWMKAKDVISHMEASPPVNPDTLTINLLLLLAHGTGSESKQNAMEVIREMTHLGLKPNLTTFLRLLGCFMKNKDATILLPIVNYIERNKEDVLRITEYSDVDFFPYAMLGARLMRDAPLARRLFILASKDQWYLVGTTETFMSHYLYVSSFELELDGILKEYQNIVPHVFVPKEWLYQILFKKCEFSNRADVALKLWHDMMKHRVYISDIDVLNRLMGAFTKRFDPEDIGQYLSAIQDVWNKLDYLETQPSSLIISVTIKMLTLNNQLDEAWKYFDAFKKYNMKPSFMALHALLKAHYSHYDKAKVIEVLEIMIKNGSFLPLSFVKDVCFNVGVPTEKRNYILKEFEKNRPSEETASENVFDDENWNTC